MFELRINFPMEVLKACAAEFDIKNIIIADCLTFHFELVLSEMK